MRSEHVVGQMNGSLMAALPQVVSICYSFTTNAIYYWVLVAAYGGEREGEFHDFMNPQGLKRERVETKNFPSTAVSLCM
ncbi:hypothetical protein M441DRAFT_69718 [Trichoderma asperellum CBS 433.97]|uniref:Uncharacterized protein n=1 Tax=Trichoderma asperellum (strain ATCC 204424 / CBS 433.97 / NBRC 101777) TaxID=1042311 RepID=A0A2T3Z4Y7_TRIA4|nr:hypothetical protein M441DRAFT_69718 [Trichoderma asperellum CBS 433.97]PTB39873.1 hypothetical protein M441DRAFT_69718 [Trichoderma asperellum CBS 433.97]